MKLSGLFLIVLSMLAISCGDTKEVEVAKDFVNALNYDLGYDVEAVKISTKQEGYVIVRDNDLNTLSAYNLSGYRKGDDIGLFLEKNESSFYHNLELSYVDTDYYWIDDGAGGYYDPIYGYSSFGGHYEVSYENIYIHEASGLLFSKTHMTSSDTIKAQELIDSIKVKKATEQLTGPQFGLKPARAKVVAGLAMQLKNSDKSTMTSYKYDQYSTAILGSTYTDLQAAIVSYVSGNEKALDGIYSKAAKSNGITVRQVKKLTELFIKN